MILAFIGFTVVAVAICYVAFRNVGATRTVVVDVVSAIDGRTIEVLLNKEKVRVMLAGIGFPKGDVKSEEDCAEIVAEMVMGRRLYMEIHKEVEGLKYVSVKSANGDCLNAMMLSRGLARYESTGVGFVSSLVEAENVAKTKGLGVWDKNRALFKQFAPAPSEAMYDLEGMDQRDY